ncbi:MAG: molybdopterin-dependent oxidoreductase [Pseudomonadota bacterium]
MLETRKHVICRSCHAHCGLIVDMEDGKPTATHGNKDNPAFHGYSCIKGRRLADQHLMPSRLLSSKKRTNTGHHDDISWETAAEEIAHKIADIQAKHGKNSVALYIGTFGFTNLSSHAFALAFMRAIESDMVFTSVTIDQPGKGIARAEHGPWLAGGYRHTEWDGLMLVGTNPLISMNGGLGLNPAKNLHAAKKRGMKLVVIDPRVTNCARQADIHLQCRPGEDPLILAAIARQIIEDKLYDEAFVKAETEGFEALKAAVAPFTPEKVAARAGLKAEDIVAAARMFGAAKKGHISAGTGPNMAGFGNVTEYLTLAITSLLGHWRRAGETKRNAGVFIKSLPALAASPGPMPSTGFGTKLRTRGLEESASGLPTAALPDEILTPGDGQIKALISLGGNPMLAWPDQIKTAQAMKALDLLVCFDVRMSKTCEMADYVMVPKLHYELHGTTAATELFGNFGAGWGFEETYGQVSDPILETPEGSDLFAEFEAFHAMAAALGKPLDVQSFALLDPQEAADNRTHIPSQQRPTAIEAWEATLNGSPVPVSEAFADSAVHKGKIWDRTLTVAPKPDDWATKLNIGSDVIFEELKACAPRLDETLAEEAYPFRVISRRLNDIHNSNWHEDPVQRRRIPHHPAYMHPDDLERLCLADGDAISIESERASISCVARSAADVRPGCLSVPHAWGTSPSEEDDPKGEGGNTGRLTDNAVFFDQKTGIPLMSAIPVKVSAL